MYGYFPNPTKSWLIVKENCVDHASALFQNAGINITVDGKRHLGAALGSRHIVVQKKVDGWVKEIDRLSSVILMQLMLHLRMVYPISGLI